MADVTEIASGYIPSWASIQGFGASSLSVFQWILLVVLFGVIGFIFFFLYLQKKKYNKKILIFERVGNRWIQTRVDRGMEIRVSTMGDTITYLRRHKKYIPNPKVQMRPFEYWVFIRGDEIWVNFELADLDLESKKIGAFFVDRDVRLTHSAINKGIKEMFDKKTFMEKYGVYVITFSFLGLIIIGTWFLWDKWVELAEVTKSAVESAGKVMESANNALAKIDTIQSGGSGLVPA